jgi:hypothetical protein
VRPASRAGGVEWDGGGGGGWDVDSGDRVGVGLGARLRRGLLSASAEQTNALERTANEKMIEAGCQDDPGKQMQLAISPLGMTH